MHASVAFTATVSLLVATVNAADTREPEEVRYFNVNPATACGATNMTAGVDPCNMSPDEKVQSEELYDICDDGTYCILGSCGTWLGKKKMCCGGKGKLGDIGTLEPQASKEACKPWKSILENYDLDKSGGTKPIEKDCQVRKWPKNYPVNVTMGDAYEIWTQGKESKYCCGVEHDAIVVFDDLWKGAKQALCVPPLDKKANGQRSNPTETTSSGGAQETKNATAPEGEKNLGRKLAPTTIVVGLTAFAAVGVFY